MISERWVSQVMLADGDTTTGKEAGYGDPLDRDVERVRQDVTEQLVSREAAAALYGVVLRDGQVDELATRARREELRRSRLRRSRPAHEVLGDEPNDPASQWIGAC